MSSLIKPAVCVVEIVEVVVDLIRRFVDGGTAALVEELWLYLTVFYEAVGEFINSNETSVISPSVFRIFDGASGLPVEENNL